MWVTHFDDPWPEKQHLQLADTYPGTAASPARDMRGVGVFFLPTWDFAMSYDGPNYTQTPNLFLDEHLPKMGCAETKVVLAVIRQTFGWHKQEDLISVSQFEDLTGLSRQGVQNGIDDALDRGVLGRTECGQGYKYYLVVKGVERHEEKACNEVEQGMQRGRTEACNEVDTQKKRNKPSQKESARTRKDDPAGVRVWVDVTGERPNIETRQILRDELTAEDGPLWDEEVFRDVLKEAWLNVGKDSDRIRIGYLLTSYEQALAREASGDGAPPYDNDPTTQSGVPGRKVA